MCRPCLSFRETSALHPHKTAKNQKQFLTASDLIYPLILEVSDFAHAEILFFDITQNQNICCRKVTLRVHIPMGKSSLRSLYFYTFLPVCCLVKTKSNMSPLWHYVVISKCFYQHVKTGCKSCITDVMISSGRSIVTIVVWFYHFRLLFYKSKLLDNDDFRSEAFFCRYFTKFSQKFRCSIGYWWGWQC